MPEDQVGHEHGIGTIYSLGYVNQSDSSLKTLRTDMAKSTKSFGILNQV